MSIFWCVAVPEKDNVGRKLNAGVQGNAKPTEFPIPKDLRIGTLDSLLELSDSLVKVDNLIEGVTRKIGNQTYSLLDRKPAKNEVFLSVESANIHTYLSQFTWDLAKYPVRLSCKELTERLQKQVASIDQELREKSSNYNQINQQLSAIERARSGNLLSKDLTDIIDPSTHIDTDYLTTFYMVVHKSDTAEFLASYANWAKPAEPIPGQYSGLRVVPTSAKVITKEGDLSLYSICLFKATASDVKTAAVSSKIVTFREYAFEAENSFETAKDQQDQLKEQLLQSKASLMKWCRVNFSEAFTAWVHLKAIRVHIECVLRYGLPANYTAHVLKLTSPSVEKKLHSALSSSFSSYSSVFLENKPNDDNVPAIGGNNEDLYPYVFTRFDLDYAQDAI